MAKRPQSPESEPASPPNIPPAAEASPEPDITPEGDEGESDEILTEPAAKDREATPPAAEPMTAGALPPVGAPSPASGGGGDTAVEPRQVAPTRAPLDVTLENLDWVFTYHAPIEDQRERYNTIARAAKNLARVILESCPSCADRTAAIRKVREAKMTANASIATHGAV
ncbi:hypothetical protein LCGC14_1284020 [marine sediment metagenome]|uniref:Acb2/Tad1 hairpin domain-containing protein n=1 Tax=marine sediment metagenome TaxID=412755 RepID=A0A0F9NXG1_9ZZZZ